MENAKTMMCVNISELSIQNIVSTRILCCSCTNRSNDSLRKSSVSCFLHTGSQFSRASSLRLHCLIHNLSQVRDENIENNQRPSICVHWFEIRKPFLDALPNVPRPRIRFAFFKICTVLSVCIFLNQQNYPNNQLFHWKAMGGRYGKVSVGWETRVFVFIITCTKRTKREFCGEIRRTKVGG